MNRRNVLAGLLVLAAPRFAVGQTGRAVTVAILSTGKSDEDDNLGAAFYAGMRAHGWVEGRNVRYERLFTQGRRERLDEIARSAVAKKPDLIFAPTGATAAAAKRATSAIPIVFIAVSDPIASGLVTTLSRPGGNATGVFHMGGDIISKRLELVRELMPQAARIGVLLDRLATDYANQRRQHETSARPSRFSMVFAEFARFDEVPAAVETLKKEGVSALTMSPSFTLASRRREFAATALRNGLPLIGYRGEWAEDGALLSYGAHVSEAHARSAQIAHRILTGARPAETPVEQASKFELIVNLRTAKALGIKVTPTLLARADRVIE